MNIRKPLLVLALLAVLAALPPAPAPAAGEPCTVYCSNANLSCSSEVGDCAVLPGDARDFLYCDGKITPCPPYFPEY
jgi:hypothetical protein